MMMLNKKYLLLILIFTSIILTTSIVSAADNTTNTTSSSVDMETLLDSTTPTYVTLQEEIQNTPENKELTLTKDYTYYRNYDDKLLKDEHYIITINKTLTINGKGHTINGNNIASTFKIESETDNVILKNIIFKNCYNDYLGHKILDIHYNTIIENCTFLNCHGSEEALGIISIHGDYNQIKDCKFINCHNTIYYKAINSKSHDGGIINMCGWYNTITNCKFTNNYINYTNYNPNSYNLKGALIYMVMDHNSIEKCTFKNNQIYKTPSAGVVKYGDVYFDSWESNITDCTFDTSSSSDNGVFIYNNAARVNITRCTFKNSDSYSIYVKGTDCILSDSQFINCKYHATKWVGNNGLMTGCTFTDCDFTTGPNYWTGANGKYIDPNNNTPETENNNTQIVDANQTNNNNTTEETTQNNTLPSKTETIPPTPTSTVKQDTVKIKKVTPKITVKKKTFKMKNKVKKYTVKITVQNKPLNKAIIKLKIKGKTYKAKTNKKGTATFKIKNLNKKGKYQGIITFPATKYYNSKKVKTWITIK